jgi:hypothetical protein
MTIEDHNNIANKREFSRINIDQPVEFINFTARGQEHQRAALLEGTSKNISESGLLFHTEAKPPKISSIIWMNLDLNTIQICQEIENRALFFNNGVIGRVVRVEEDVRNNVYDVGVCFVTKDQKESQDVQKLLTDIRKVGTPR